METKTPIVAVFHSNTGVLDLEWELEGGGRHMISLELTNFQVCEIAERTFNRMRYLVGE